MPAVEADELIEVPAVIVESDADEWDTEIGRFFAVIAGEDAEAPGINRERAVQREFRGKIGDGATGKLGIAAREPRPIADGKLLKALHHRVIPREKLGVARALLQPIRIDLPQELDGVMTSPLPEPVVEAMK